MKNSVELYKKSNRAEAIQFDGKNFIEVMDFMATSWYFSELKVQDGTGKDQVVERANIAYIRKNNYLLIPILAYTGNRLEPENHVHYVGIGDWIVCNRNVDHTEGPAGEDIVCVMSTDALRNYYKVTKFRFRFWLIRNHFKKI